MKLKRLEIHGFKSFPERTVFKFQPDGLTTVVGPNGCGKSNIVDAVRWALGEQSAKLLRGQMMEDVIFNGSDRRKPLGMAEVTLLFDNDGTLNSQWRDYAEISISRRLYRTGESDYLINGVPCRLKDIRELLADAGSSSRGYSIVEQGRISLLINSKPEEKRALIEEAAGVLKYRMRRLEAERKIERTKQNLFRVSDVIREVKRQLDSLKRSAAKARRYRRLRDELDQLVLHLRFVEFVQIEDQLGRLEKELSSKRSLLELKEAELGSLEAREEKLRLELASGEEQITDCFEKVRAIESEIARLEGDISVRESSISSLNERIARLKDDEIQLQKQGETERTERAQLELELKTIEDESQRHEEDLDTASNSYTDAAAKLEGNRSSLEQMRSRIFSLGTERARLNSEVQSGVKALSGLERRKDEIDGKTDTLDAGIRAARKTRSEREAQLGRITSSRDGINTQLDDRRDSLSGNRKELADLEAGIADLSEKLAEVRGLQRTLATLEEDMEGFSEGVRGVLKEYAGSEASGVLGVVADHVEVPQTYEKATMAVLGERLQHVIVDKPESGLSAVSFLKQRARGRGGFIPKLPRANGKETGTLKEARGEGVLGPLTDLVQFSDELNGVGEFLLGDALVVEDLGKALDLWRKNGITATLVTLDGDVVEPTGVITGGSMEGGEADLLARKRRLREVRETSASLEAKLKSSRSGRDSMKERIASDEKELGDLEIRHRELDRDFMDEEGSLAVLVKELNHHEKTAEGLRLEKEMVDDEVNSIRSHMDQSRARLGEAEKEEEQAREQMDSLETEARRLDVEVERLRRGVEEARIRVNTASLKKESSMQALESARTRSQDVEDRENRIHEEIVDSKHQIQLHRDEIQTGSESVVKLVAGLEDRKEQLVQLREEQQESRSESTLLTGKIREIRSKAANVRNESAEIDIRVHELRTERENLAERVQEDHNLQLSSLTEDDFDTEGFDRVAASEQIGSLRQKISTLGEVNPGAVEEFDELNERYEFLTTQKADLEESIESLQKAIRKINRTSKERFLTTFKEVSENFSRLFPVLFAGGSGELVLVDETDPLNTGVEIQVKPPGKKLKNMQLLSGGEKALVSLTMILSMFLAKPSPFCILDEVDAPLDDDNLGHFATIIKDLSKDFQFLVITHNKLTMESADVLYGITMREPGVSQVVSVRMKDVA